MSDTTDDDYRTLHRAYWDDRAAAHASSRDYALDRFAADPSFVSDVVRFDLPRLGDVTGLVGVHLQCHIGTDTVSLARLGARMTGLDLSPASLEQARHVNEIAGTDVTFVEGEVYAAPELLPNAAFDLVFTGIGALCWLPDIVRWAEVVAALLKPGGRLFLREGHPVMWALEDGRPDDLLVMRYPYFQQQQALPWEESGTYVETEQTFSQTRTLNWNFGLGEIVTALLDAGLQLTMLVEHESVPWLALPGQMVEVGDGEWALAVGRERAPMTYTLQAVKR